jgi:hypothetical protein
MPTSRRLSMPLIVMFAMIIAVVTLAGPANAVGYANQPKVSVSNQAPAAGSSITISGSGFTPGETVTIRLDNGTQFPSVVANASGSFSEVVVLGVGLAGAHTITATGTTSGHSASIKIQVAGVGASAIPNASGTGLAFTGASVIGIGALGGLLLVGGGLMLLAGRRRKFTN